MKTANKASRFIGVTMAVLNNKDHYWVCRVQRKKLRFKKRFPFTDRGEELAGETYQQKIKQFNDLYAAK